MENGFRPRPLWTGADDRRLGIVPTARAGPWSSHSAVNDGCIPSSAITS
ncbi:hypothetical protein STRAU_3733 [Streptomyces aurantiacus JA 4570]|uniref:Uncharacterized protein n=1 Tax=Streptomyces aurantiacus JA 4570 TaxID=1286094 RepID=S3ZJ43_9ACTN|nr:hypothetical protein STRAU_3733 [Streptomyces aurantiacus JA 4570]